MLTVGVPAVSRAAVAITVSPTAADIFTGGQITITPTVTGSTNTGVQWSLSPNIGSISVAGVYTAPTSLTQDTPVTITATALADLTKTATSLIDVHANGIFFTTNANGLASMDFLGTNYNYVYTSEGLLTLVYLQPPGGAITQYTPTCSGTFTTTTVTKNCTANGDSFTTTVTYSVTSYGTIQAQIVFTNNAVSDTVTTALFSTFGVTFPQYNASSSTLGLSESSPLSVVNFVTGRFAIWDNTPGPNVAFNQPLGYTYICKNQPELLNVGPGQTATATFSLRFTTNLTEDNYTLAPEAYQDYEAAYPYLVNWPDRRPIMQWFMSDYGHQSATNPRGYFNQPTLNVSNISSFQSTALAQAQAILTSMQARPVQPQGIVLWDVEGQEFIQPTSYIGDPRVLAPCPVASGPCGYSAEMNAAADQIFALFKNAGYKVGVTLRPDYLQWGPAASLPATCNFNTDNNFKDYYIEVDQPFLQKFYGCYAANAWSLVPAGNGSQTIYQTTQVQQVINLMLAKVAYARARWGTTLYYVDSTVWDGGATMTASIFRALQQAYPDSLFMPEESYIGTMAVAMPFAAYNGSLNSLFAPETWRWAYPNAAQVTNLSNCSGTCWTSDEASYDIGQKIGDIAMYSVPTQLTTTQLGNIEAMILQARSEAGTINVTDSSSGLIYPFSGTPATIYPAYPVKMRVYFADSTGDLAASTTYRENGGLLGTNSCTLNLAGLTTTQVRYYDFESNLVVSEPSQTAQTINFGAISSVTFGVTPFALTATASSGLTVGYTSGTPTVCSVSSSTVTILGAGSCSITATQPGNTNYDAAPAVTQSFTVNQAPQTISFGPINNLPFALRHLISLRPRLHHYQSRSRRLPPTSARSRARHSLS